MFVLLRTERMQLRNHGDAQTEKRSIYIPYIKFRMLEVRENETALRKLPGGVAHLRGNTDCCPLGCTVSGS